MPPNLDLHLHYSCSTYREGRFQLGTVDEMATSSMRGVRWYLRNSKYCTLVSLLHTLALHGVGRLWWSRVDLPLWANWTFRSFAQQGRH